MANLTVDLDRIARSFRADLDSATAHIIAASVPGAELNHSNGIRLASNVLSISQFILDNSDLDGHNRDRFRSFRDEAEKQVNAFWKTFDLAIIRRANGTTAVIHPTPQPEKTNGHAVKKPTIPSGARALPAETQKMIFDLLESCKPHPTQADMRNIAEQVGVGFSTVMRYYYNNR